MKKYKYFIIAFFIVLAIIISLLYNEPMEITNNEEITTIEKIEIPKTEKIKIDIKGAIKKPGIYELDNNTRVIDAINTSGGLLNTADTSTINLSKKLSDEMVIIVYTKDEIEKNKKQEVKVEYIEKECICPKIEENNALIKDLININTAAQKDLQTLDGIGEAKAKEIIEYRKNVSLFKNIEDIMNVPGIGQTLFDKFKDQITT